MNTKNQSKLAAATLAITLMATSWASYAGFRVVDQVQPKAARPTPAATPAIAAEDQFGFSTGRPVVKESGLPRERDVRHGFGRDLPIALVLQQIVPKGWHTEVAPKGAATARVASWSGGKPWTDVLAAVATSTGTYVDLDWDRSSVVVTVPEKKAATQVASAVSAAPHSPKSPSVSAPGAASGAATAKAAPAQTREWVANHGESLRLTTERWAASAGWTVYWNLKNGADYETIAVRSQEDFLKALRQLYAPYMKAEGDRDRPLRVSAYPRQNIIVITE